RRERRHLRLQPQVLHHGAHTREAVPDALQRLPGPTHLVDGSGSSGAHHLDGRSLGSRRLTTADLSPGQHSRQSARAMRAPRGVRTAEQSLGESPLWPSAAVVTSAILYADLPTRFIAGPSAGAFSVVRWVIPALTVVLLVALLVSLPGGRLT